MMRRLRETAYWIRAHDAGLTAVPALMLLTITVALVVCIRDL